MSIKDYWEKVKPGIRSLYLLILGLIIASIFFALGRLSAIEERYSPVRIIQPGDSQTANVMSALDGQASDTAQVNPSLYIEVPAVSTNSGEVVGSKTGKKYYFPWCGTIKRTKPENQVHFASIAEAKAAGYTAGGNCKGLE